MLDKQKRTIQAVIGTIFVIIASLPAFSQNNQNENLNAITTAVPFLLIAPDTRAGAMGDAGVSSAPDANSVYWNPAKLGFIEKDMGFSLSYIPWLRALVPDINLSYLSGFKKLDRDQTIAASLFYSSLGQINFTAEDGAPLGNYRPNEFSFNGAYSRKLSDNFSGGVGAKYVYSNLTMGQTVGGAQTKPGQSFAMDISMYYQKDDLELGGTAATFAFGTNVSNIGSKMSYSNAGTRNFIPINLRLGPTLTLKPDEYNSIAFTVDAMKLLVPTPPVLDPLDKTKIIAGKNPDVGVAAGIFQSFGDAPGVLNDDGSRSVRKEELREINLAFGTEYWYDKQFALRFGYFHEHATKGNRKFLTFGAGLKYNVFGLDLAYLVATQQRNPLGNTFRFTLTFDFDAFKSQSN